MLCDQRMGPRNHYEKCMYCNEIKCNCSLFGYIELKWPVLWSHYEKAAKDKVNGKYLGLGMFEKDGMLYEGDLIVPDYYCKRLLVLKTQLRPYLFVKGEWVAHPMTIAYNKVLKATTKEELYPAVNGLANMIVNKKGETRGGNVAWNLTPYQGVFNELGGKHGQFRELLCGRRVDFSARSVITSNPTLRIDQVGIPQEMSKILTVPEQVHLYNKNHLVQMILNMKCTIVIRLGGTRFKVMTNNAKYLANKLQIGDVVHRHLQDGDPVIFGRQPTLHKGSIMAFDAKIISGLTLQMSVDVTQPFNADFDGDCMYIVVPQSIEARSDALHVMHVRQLVVEECYFGFVQHVVWGWYELSMNRVVTLQEYNDALCWVRKAGVVKSCYTGHDILSLVFDVDFNYGDVVVNGEWVSVGSDQKMLFEICQRICSPIWMRNTRMLIMTQMRGMSIGWEDCVVKNTDAMLPMDALMIQTKNHCDPDNRILSMIQSGTKGKIKDLVTMNARPDVPLVAGKPLPLYLGDRQFPMRHTMCSGLVGGLGLVDVFALACKARYDVSARALLTKRTGYLSRKLNYLLVSTSFPGEVDNGGGIVRFDDGRIVSFNFEFPVSSGTSLGLVAASAIASPLTQSVLDTFHTNSNEGNENELIALLTMSKKNKNSYIIPYELDVVHTVENLWAVDERPSYVQRFRKVWPHIGFFGECPVFRLTFARDAPHRPFIEMKNYLIDHGIEFFLLSDDEYDPVYELQTPCDVRSIFHIDPTFKGERIGKKIKIDHLPTTLDSLRGVEFSNVHEVYQLLGVEAARGLLLKRFRELLPTVERKFLVVLVDVLTQTGEIANVNYKGIMKTTSSIFSKMSFEHAKKTLVRSALNDLIEPFVESNPRMMKGDVVARGTGAVHLLTSQFQK